MPNLKVRSSAYSTSPGQMTEQVNDRGPFVKGRTSYTTRLWTRSSRVRSVAIYGKIREQVRERSEKGKKLSQRSKRARNHIASAAHARSNLLASLLLPFAFSFSLQSSRSFRSTPHSFLLIKTVIPIIIMLGFNLRLCIAALCVLGLCVSSFWNVRVSQVMLQLSLASTTAPSKKGRLLARASPNAAALSVGQTTSIISFLAYAVPSPINLVTSAKTSRASKAESFARRPKLRTMSHRRQCYVLLSFCSLLKSGTSYSLRSASTNVVVKLETYLTGSRPLLDPSRPALPVSPVIPAAIQVIPASPVTLARQASLPIAVCFYPLFSRQI